MNLFVPGSIISFCSPRLDKIMAFPFLPNTSTAWEEGFNIAAYKRANVIGTFISFQYGEKSIEFLEVLIGVGRVFCRSQYLAMRSLT